MAKKFSTCPSLPKIDTKKGNILNKLEILTQVSKYYMKSCLPEIKQNKSSHTSEQGNLSSICPGNLYNFITELYVHTLYMYTLVYKK